MLCEQGHVVDGNGKHRSYQEWWRQCYSKCLIPLETGGLSIWRTSFHFLGETLSIAVLQESMLPLTKRICLLILELWFYFTAEAEHTFHKDKAKSRHFATLILQEMQRKTCCCQASSSVTFYLAPHLSWDATGIHVSRTCQKHSWCKRARAAWCCPRATSESLSPLTKHLSCLWMNDTNFSASCQNPLQAAFSNSSELCSRHLPG